MNSIKPSGTIQMAEKSNQMECRGKLVYHLDVGQPDFDTPYHIRNAAITAIEKGFTRYTSSRGTLELRQVIAEDLSKRDIEANPEKEIIVMPGAKHALYCACLATLNPNDEVLVLSPTWPTHIQCIQMADAKPIEIPCGPCYKLNEEILKANLTDYTKMILMNSPNNPTGGVIHEISIKAIVDIAVDNDLLLISDEIYDRIVFDNVKIRSPASCKDALERTVIINGFSKAYAMTGWRIGYAFANKDISEAMMRIQQSTTTCPASFTQKAAIAALKGQQDIVKKMIEEYDKRRRFLVENLNKIDRIKCAMPEGAFYVFLDISELGISSFEFCDRLLKEMGVSTTPGNVFGTYGEGFIRISYATSLEIITEAINKIREFVSKYWKGDY